MIIFSHAITMEDHFPSRDYEKILVSPLARLRSEEYTRSMRRWRVRRDNVVLADDLVTEDEAWAFLLRHQGNSIYHATMFEGYVIEPYDKWS